ncbi:hypothetical protein [uncultured Clostridium sp.]|uniref:hypothetical protein n=1 Tax=uncultured Clostridium sp. TaxID=59620 RepID=UPI0027DD7F8C|nr:hypothetical protein [uncultured Clostridium sp.]
MKKDLILIKSTEEFIKIRNEQGLREIYTRKEIKEITNKLQLKNKEFTILSIQDENDGTPSYITEGIRWCNNIGYYVLEGNFSLENDISL